MISESLTEVAIPHAVSLPDFASLVREHQAMVFSQAHSFLRNAGLAEEIAQDVFVELYRALPSLESREHIIHWLRRVTAHRSIDVIRRRRPTLSLADVGEPPVPSGEGDVLLEERLRRLVANLPASARMAVILRYQEDLDPRDIAEILDLPVRTVKSRLNRSLAILREKLARHILPPLTRSHHE